MMYAERKPAKEREKLVWEFFQGVCCLINLHKHWFTSEVFVDAINWRFDISPEVTKTELDCIVSRHPQYDEFCRCKNDVGLYTQKRQMKNMHSNDGKRRKYRFYWCGNKKENPPDMESWYCRVDEFSFLSRRVKPLYDSSDIEVNDDDDCTGVDLMIGSSKVSVNPWDSTEYQKLFGMREGEETLDESIDNMLNKLEQGISGDFIGVVHNFEQHSDVEFMTTYAQTRVRIKCMYLSIALESALEGYYQKKKINWTNCCENAVSVLKDVPLESCSIVRCKSVMEWFVKFRSNGCRIIVPSVSMKNVEQLTLIFSVYPEFKEACTKFIDNRI